jgi:hypothetical protein
MYNPLINPEVSMTKFRIAYAPENGVATPDGLCVDLVDELISLRQFGDVSYTTATASVITAFRLAAAEKKISVDDVVFVFDGADVTMDNKFELSAWPKQGDIQGNMLGKIMQARKKV